MGGESPRSHRGVSAHAPRDARRYTCGHDPRTSPHFLDTTPAERRLVLLCFASGEEAAGRQRRPDWSVGCGQRCRGPQKRLVDAMHFAVTPVRTRRGDASGS